ncbi:hypothetical protein BMS3Abin15_00759 [bacterium BMS3Abin15]|nr:hypothetical protein BMS3Abin15_00759 [bacterium BMS3Abin15]
MKKYSVKFWIIFWIIAVALLASWFLFWEIKNRGIRLANVAIDYLPLKYDEKDKYKNVINIADYLLKDGKERTFLVLLQNNMELRPGGGYIGTFGILKIENGRVKEIQTHDLSNFDARIPNIEKPPYPMEETLSIKYWKLRDSNYSPDFIENAKKAEYFYKLGEGQEELDGTIAITANVLLTALEVIGPIQIEGYPGTYDSENAIMALEYQVEKGYIDQDVEKGERKSIMNELAEEIADRVSDLSISQKLKLFKVIVGDLDKKDIQLYFKDAELQKIVEKANWGGAVDESWNKDYLMVVDANLGAFKSDYYIKRSMDYNVDLSGDIPKANLKITYNHTATQKDWMTRDYLTYVRMYVPDGAWLKKHPGLENPQFGEEFGKKYFGFIVETPIGTSRTVEFQYDLPKELKSDSYDLKIQKQAGVNDIPVKIKVKGTSGNEKEYNTNLNSDIILSELELRN